MKQFSYFLISAFCLIFLFTQTGAAQNPTSFPVGEKLTYNISFATFPDAGFVELYAAGTQKIDNHEVNAVRAKLRTNGIVQSTLLDLNHEATTFLSTPNNLPVKTARVLRENNETIEVVRNFSENQTLSDANVHDLISAFYQVRRFDFSTNAVQTIKVWQSERVIEVKLQSAKRETVSTTIGAVNALVIQIKTDDENFNRYKAKIYLSDDDRRIPVAITLRLPQGEVRADLAAVQIVPPETVAIPQPEVLPTPQPTVQPTPRPSVPRPTPKPYVDNQPLDADLPFALGEKLTFEVMRGAQKIGNMQLEIKERKLFNGRDAVLLRATVQPAGNGNVFTAADKIESFINPDFLVPFKQEIRLSNALAAYNQVLNFDQELGAATNDKGLRVEIPVGTHDILSFVYALRAFRFSVTQKNAPDTKAAVFLNNSPVVVTLKSTAEKIDYNNRKVAAISLTAVTGNPAIDSLGIRLWLSDDQRRLPLKLTFNSTLGAVQANLINFSN